MWTDRSRTDRSEYFASPWTTSTPGAPLHRRRGVRREQDEEMDENSEIDVREEPDRRAFVLRVDGAEAGRVVYHRRQGGGDVPAAIVLIHTEVDDAYAGRGLAGRLVRAVFDAARAEGVVLVPRCPYAQQWLGKHPDYLADVPAHDRQELGLDEPHREEAS
ncbi:GNAT family N-acetyltransferase [Actinomycetospora flava]|uniref:GNAT family N-acetyltransferase n=1 Tax=Actinomycetospora flava TaxID=3129232 RepID=A0ABU8MD72_9PSEU